MTDRNAFTRKLLLDSGIEKGMRVLDVGCGNGEVSFLLQELMEGTGEIIGIDSNEAAIAAAKNMADEKQLINVRFMAMNIEDVAATLGPFDRIVGRRIVMYLPDPLQAIKTLAKVLDEEGRMIFQESDATGSGSQSETFPLHTMAQQWVWQTVVHEKGNSHIGTEMYTLFKKAGLQVESVRAEPVLQTAETGSDLGWLLGVMRERIVAAGVSESELARLTETALSEEMAYSQAIFIRDMNFGICVSN